jgi:hypothetical protein
MDFNFLKAFKWKSLSEFCCPQQKIEVMKAERISLPEPGLEPMAFRSEVIEALVRRQRNMVLYIASTIKLCAK